MPVATLSRPDAPLASTIVDDPFEGRLLHPPGPLHAQRGAHDRYHLDKPTLIPSRAIDRHAYATEHHSTHLRTLLAVLSDPIAINGLASPTAKDSHFNQHPNTTSVSQTFSHNSERDDFNISSYCGNPHFDRSPQLSISSTVPLSPDLQHAIYSTDPSIYARICEPLSEWLAEYMWKVVTTGLSLPCSASSSGLGREGLPIKPDAILADSICSLLLSTLLQPSVIILALHYISRLPGCITHCAAGVCTSDTEFMFYSALTSIDSVARDNANSQALYAAFKLFVVASILSNKLLDDHVFTLKTWHEVSGIPLKSLNKLEWLSLDLLGHDLCVDTPAWDHWLASIKSYHLWLGSRANGHFSDTVSFSLMGYILENISSTDGLLPKQPLFLGLEERIRTAEAQHLPQGIGASSEFDSDDESPLREEYVPKRSFTTSSTRVTQGLPVVPTWNREHTLSSLRSSQPGLQQCPSCTSWPPSPLESFPYDGTPAADKWGHICWEDSRRIPVPQSMFDSSACTIVGFTNRSCGKEYTLRDYFLSYTRSSSWAPVQ